MMQVRTFVYRQAEKKLCVCICEAVFVSFGESMAAMVLVFHHKQGVSDLLPLKGDRVQK